MPAKKKTEYELQGKVSKISAVSRCAIKVVDNFYTIEASEEREIPNYETANMDKEWSALFDEINNVVDAKCEEILDTFKK